MLFSSPDILAKKFNPIEHYLPKFVPLPELKESIKTEAGSYSHRNTMNNLSGKEWIKFTRSWFEHHPPPRKKDTGEVLHPAKFPEDLIANFIQFFTKQGDWVLDPFLGTGSTLVACDMTKRNGIGVELTEKWARIAEKRTEQYVIHGDARDIPNYQLPPIDFCISSPPYWDMLNHSRGGSDSTQKERLKKGMDASFSDNPEDFGNIPAYDAFMIQLLDLYRGILQVMKPGKYCGVVMQNTLKSNQEYFPMAWEFALKMRDIGWQMCQEFIWCSRDKKLGIWGYPNTYISNVHHHYILIFKKPSIVEKNKNLNKS